MSEKLTLREKLHIGEKRTDGEKPRMSKKLKKGIIAAACVVGVCGAVWGGLTIARNAQRGDVNVYAVNECAMTDYWGDTSNTSGMVTTDKLQKIYISQSQTVKKVWVKEGDSVKKGTVLVSYDSTLTQATVERAKIDYDRQTENLEVMKNELELLKKAKNKETLEAEKTKLEAELQAEISRLDGAGGYDPEKAVEPGLVTPMAEGSGNSKDKPIYYYWLTDDGDGGEHGCAGAEQAHRGALSGWPEQAAGQFEGGTACLWTEGRHDNLVSPQLPGGRPGGGPGDGGNRRAGH